jgi:hypothetical protein
MENITKELLEKYETSLNKVDWDCISTYQKLSEEFIEKFEDIACIVHNGNKIRARKLKIVEVA